MWLRLKEEKSVSRALVMRHVGMKDSREQRSLLGIVFHLLLYLCEDRSPVMVAWITLCKLVVVVPCCHTRRVCDDRPLRVRKCFAVQKELRPCTFGIGLQRRSMSDQ